MAYPEKLLTDDEVVIRDFHPHWRVLITAFAWVVLALGIVIATFTFTDGTDGTLRMVVTLVAIVGALALAVPAIVNRQFLHYILTSERLITRGGILSKSGVEIPLEQINNVLFEQKVWERMLGYGDVIIESAGEGGRTIFQDIPDPQGFQSEVYRAREDRGMVLRGSGPSDPSQQIERLARLRDEGSLTEAEFSEAKRRLLDGL